MKRVKTRCDLHPFGLIDCISVSEDNTAFFKCRPSVREKIFYYKIFRNLSIYERCGIYSVSCLYALEIAYAKAGQFFKYLI